MENSRWELYDQYPENGPAKYKQQARDRIQDTTTVAKNIRGN